MESGQLVFVTSRNSGESTVIKVSEANFENTRTYLDAHRLIPWDFEWDAPGGSFLIDLALALLEDESREEVEHLWALAILGHVPTAEALLLLRQWADSHHPLAGVAEMAALECADWMSNSESQLC